MAEKRGFAHRQSSSNCSACAMKDQMLRLILEEKEDLRIAIKVLEERNSALEQEVKKLKGLKAQEKSSVPPVTVDTGDTDSTLRSAMHAADPGEGNRDGSGKSSRYVTESETGHSFIPSGATQPTSEANIAGQASDGSYTILDQIHIEQARDVAIASNGDLFVASRHDHCVYVYTEDTQGKMVRKAKIGSKGSGKLQFNEPHGMAIHGSIVYLTEYEGNRVHVFQIINSNASTSEQYAQYVDMLSEWSGGSDRLYNPHDVKLDSEGLVYVADRSNDRVLVFRHNINSKEWTMLHEFDLLRTSGNGHPEGIAFDAKGYVHITNYSGSQSITVFTKQAELSRVYYKDNKMKGIIPKGIAINSAGLILVTAIECPGTEKEEGHLMVFDEDGNRLHHISGRVFTNPFGIWITKGNKSVIWVADMVLDKVLKLELSCLK